MIIEKRINIIITVVMVVSSFAIAAYIISYHFLNNSEQDTPEIIASQYEALPDYPINRGSTQIGSVPTMLKVYENRITNDVNSNILLKGLMPPDLMVLNDQNRLNKAFFERMKSAGANVIRFPVHPDLWIKNADYLEDYIVPAVSWANELNMYAIIDLHYIGNILTGSGNEMPKIGIHPKELSEDFWAKVASRFKDSPNVIFEICNEPASINAEQWFNCARNLVELIRKQGAGQMVIVGGIQYSQNLSWVKEKPIPDNNVAYASHIYPAHNSSNWEGWFGDISAYKPVIVTEWGFIDENRNETKQQYLVGNKESYGIPFLNYLDEKNIGWVACWFDDTWEPEMFKDEESGYTNYGQFVIEKLEKSAR